MDSTMPTNMKTLDCIFGLSLIAAKPAAPTNPKPIPEPAAARPNAIPAPINLADPASDVPPVSACPNAQLLYKNSMLKVIAMVRRITLTFSLLTPIIHWFEIEGHI